MIPGWLAFRSVSGVSRKFVENAETLFSSSPRNAGIQGWGGAGPNVLAWMPAFETVDLLRDRVCVHSSSPRKRGSRGGKSAFPARIRPWTPAFAGVTILHPTFTTVSKAGIHAGTFGPAPPLDARFRGHDVSVLESKYSTNFRDTPLAISTHRLGGLLPQALRSTARYFPGATSWQLRQ